MNDNGTNKLPFSNRPFIKGEIEYLFRAIEALKAIGEDDRGIFVEYHHGTFESILP